MAPTRRHRSPALSGMVRKPRVTAPRRWVSARLQQAQAASPSATMASPMVTAPRRSAGGRTTTAMALSMWARSRSRVTRTRAPSAAELRPSIAGRLLWVRQAGPAARVPWQPGPTARPKGRTVLPSGIRHPQGGTLARQPAPQPSPMPNMRRRWARVAWLPASPPPRWGAGKTATATISSIPMKWPWLPAPAAVPLAVGRKRPGKRVRPWVQAARPAATTAPRSAAARRQLDLAASPPAMVRARAVSTPSLQEPVRMPRATTAWRRAGAHTRREAPVLPSATMRSPQGSPAPPPATTRMPRASAAPPPAVTLLPRATPARRWEIALVPRVRTASPWVRFPWPKTTT